MDNFWKNVDKTDDCWIWMGHKSTGGYGQLTYQGKTNGAHRVSYIMKHGSIPAGYAVHHTCHTRACVNPDHLEILTRAEHLSAHLDSVAAAAKKRHAARTECKHGHPFTEANTYLYTNAQGYTVRQCRTCHNLSARQYKKRKKSIDFPG